MYNVSFYKTSFWLLLLVFSVMEVSAQENPPIPIEVEVRTSRNLNFGSFVAGNSIAYVTVDYNGNRTVDGDIVALSAGEPVSAALFDVYANPGTIIQIQQVGDTELTNGNGGTIYLSLDSFSTGQTFVTQAPNADTRNEVFVGGTLTIPADNSGNLPGRYNGSFMLNFIHQ